MTTRRIGTPRTIGKVSVSAIGLGGMPLSIDGRPGGEQALAPVLAAIDVRRALPR